MTPPLPITHIQRRPHSINFSIEQIFRNVRAHMSPDVRVTVWECPHLSSGFWARLGNMLAARVQTKGVRHVTGDVHYVTLLLPSHSTVLTIHDVVALHRLRGARRFILLWLWYVLPIRRARVVTTISEFVRSELVALCACPESKVHVVYDPISDDLYPSPRPFRSDSPRALLIGSAWNKNLTRQIEALGGLGVEVDVVGQLAPEHIAAFERGNVRYCGYRNLSDSEMIRRYIECDFVLFASLYEGFGMPIAEANAVGRPVVTSNVASMPEVAGGAACLVDPMSVESIRTGVRRILEDATYRDDLVQRGFSNAQRFTAAEAARRYADIYRAMRPQ
jgi:glycosyltransferase involved in cell wall biosynthesis